MKDNSLQFISTHVVPRIFFSFVEDFFKSHVFIDDQHRLLQLITEVVKDGINDGN